MFRLLTKLRATKARKIAKANADSAFSQAKARYDLALNARKTQLQHEAGLTLKGVQTERLRLELELLKARQAVAG